MRFGESDLEACRFTKEGDKWATKRGDLCGLFFVPSSDPSSIYTLKVIADNGATTGWEHVSVSLPHRAPTWSEMCRIKDLFWSNDETVVQFHPKRSDYVNIHPHCLHLWRRCGVEMELPPTVLV